MSVGRSLAEQRGKIVVGASMVATQWKGLTVLRTLPGTFKPPQTPMPPPTPAQQQIRNAITFLDSQWSLMSTLQRAKWDSYAKTLGSAYDEGKRKTASGGANIIPPSTKVQSGIDTFLGSNLIRVRSGLPFPVLEAPFSESTAVSPTNVTLSYNSISGVATVTFDNPADFDITWLYRLWAKGISFAHPQLVASVSNSPITFNSLKGLGGISSPLSTHPNKFLRVQMDTITTSMTHGSISSAPSNIDEKVLL